ncbi:ribonuclease HII [Hazenella sp. IB182357]|uniref:Ribonuclease HII n=1 Tax=Polycladospora coralii TaxID=2771432 RepID=A0A926N8R3_9BACL|nr:ribonuclease HII [Polycladospora coralii]MBD1371427.1 ribonuclease HII [Polycladospora coralii]MBS7530395.1 ribonuclease HII [Polycladospora coralii]
MKNKTQTIREIKAWLSTVPDLQASELQLLQRDSRAGVQKLLQSFLREKAKKQQELERLARMWKYEEKYRDLGYQWIAGVDEAGRGPLAGPVVAATVILPPDFDVTGLNDSKQVSEPERKRLRDHIKQHAIAYGIGYVHAAEIDQINILQATYLAMRKSIETLKQEPSLLLTDAVTIPQVPVPQRAFVKGDTLSHSIAAASILAKTARDEWMRSAAQKYPQYGFEKHMGYPTPDHLAMLERWGPTDIHRMSFAPVEKRMRGVNVAQRP